jgi:hypothetical protein
MPGGVAEPMPPGAQAAISQTQSLRTDSRLILHVLACAAGVGGFAGGNESSKGPRGSASEGEREKGWKPPTCGRGGFHCKCVSAGIRPRGNEKLIRQPLGQIAKPERTVSEMTANLPVKEHQGQGEGQNPNHGEHNQCLAAPLMYGCFLR